MIRGSLLANAHLAAALAMLSPERTISLGKLGRLGYLVDRLFLERHGFAVAGGEYAAVFGSATNLGLLRTISEGFNPLVRGKPMFDFQSIDFCRAASHVTFDDLDLHSIAVDAVIQDCWSEFGGLDAAEVDAVMSDRSRFPELETAEFGAPISFLAMLEATGCPDSTANLAQITDYERTEEAFLLARHHAF